MKTKTDLEAWIRQVRRCNDTIGLEEPDPYEQIKKDHYQLMSHIMVRAEKLTAVTGKHPDMIVLGCVERTILRDYLTATGYYAANSCSDYLQQESFQGMRLIPSNDDSFIAVGYITDI